jgi:hypothetical protein
MRYARFLSTVALSGALASVGTAARAGSPTNIAAPSADGANAASDDLSLSGALHDSDPADGEGHHFRTRTIQLNAGETVEVAAQSDAFDTVLRVNGPSLSLTNDDAQGEGTNSRLRFTAPATGTYSIVVTSYNAGETGEYQLSVQRGADANANAQPGATNCNGACPTAQPAMPTMPTMPAPTMPAYGQPQPGTYAQPSNGAYVPRLYGPVPADWHWDPAAGMFMPPARSPATNSGDDGSSVAQQDDPADAGELDPGSDASLDPSTPVDNTNAGTGTVYGVFVAVSDYQGQNQSLDDTTADARNLAASFEHSGLMRHGNGIVLTDGHANGAEVRQAFETIGRRVTARDTFVFFFDGHGNSNEVELQSGGLTSNELSGMLNQVHGRQLLVLDSCESGGFASIVRGHANRVGLFSSRASESSYVASEVHSGGWLAYFMIEAVRANLHGGNDGALHLNELTAYVQRGYAQRVHDQQHLVVASGAGQQAVLWHAGRSSVVAMNP